MVRSGKSKHSLMSTFIGILGLVLTARLFMLTVIQNEKWNIYADDMSKRAVYETAARGNITDRNGKVVAGSRPVYSAVISRVNVQKEQALASAAEVMNMLEENGENITVTQNEVSEKLSDTSYDAYMPIVLAEDISEQTAKLIADGAYAGVQLSVNYVREYPYGTLASHIIGYLGRISEDETHEYVEVKGCRKDALIGKSGIERAFEDKLRGTDGVSTFQVDSQGKVTDFLEYSSSTKGEDVRLTIDIDIQKTAEDALEKAITQAACGGIFESEYGDYSMVYAENAASGAAVAIDVKTGEVLAMASFPDFDPNDFAENISREKWQSLQTENENDPLSPSPLYNIAAMSAVQPGSTFKPVTALAALECGLDENRYLYDAGAVDLNGHKYGCSLWNDTKAVHGYVNLKDAMKVSCNYYFYDIAFGKDFASGSTLGYEKNIDNEMITDYAAELGLGKKTGIEIEESQGVLPSEEQKKGGLKNSLENFLLVEGETYFTEDALQDRENMHEITEKIANWADKDLTLQEIIGKLKDTDSVKNDKINELASICYSVYYSQMEWNQGDTFNISIGQGDNAYTTLQMANYMASLGNGGIRNDATLISDNYEKNSKESGISSENLKTVIEAMMAVANEPGGSLYAAFGKFPYEVAAKTGTAQRAGKINTADEREYLKTHLHLISPGTDFLKVEAEAKRLMKAYPDIYDEENGALRRAVINLSAEKITAEDIDRYKESYDSFAWTVALAPADDPQIAVAVMLVQGKASSNAAPVVREIIGKYGEKARWEKSF